MQGENNPDQDLNVEDEISLDFDEKMKLGSDLQEFFEEDGDEEDVDFSFICGESGSSPIAAEDAFIDGKIKSGFPFFRLDVFLSEEESEFSLSLKPPVSKVFLETKDSYTDLSLSTSGNNGIAGGWSDRKAVEVSPDSCKKSNSTGFSKIWRFKEFMGRSNSDGRDAFVFLNNSHAQSRAEEPATVSGTVETKVKREAPAKKAGKIKTTPLSAHAIYLKSKAKEEEKRRSYLPYRPELMGFFTNVNSGLSKNIHPF